MANRTVKDAKSIKGTNPQYLVEKIIRTRIYDCQYWKEECFALTAELLVDKAMELRYIGGVYGGNVKPTPFLCLILKMLQIQPEKDIIVEFIKNEDFKYVRALGAYYMRLTGTALDCYNYLEPLLNDNRKLRRQNRSGVYELIHMDEFVDELLREERACDVILPRLQKRHVLEENNEIQPRLSILEEDEDEEDDDEGELKGDESKYKRTNSPDREKERKNRHRHKDDKERRRRKSSDSDSEEERRRRRKRRGSSDDERHHKSESSRQDKRRSPVRDRDRDHRRNDRGDRDRRSPDRERDRKRDHDRDRERSKKDKHDRDRDRDRDSRRDRDYDRDREKHHHRSSRK